MKNTTCIICHAVACILAVEGANAASGSSLLGALFRPLDALNLHSALNPSNLLHGDRTSFGTEQRQFLPKQGDMSLLDSTNTFELLSTLRQGRSTLTDYLQGRTTGFSSQKFTIVSALFGDDAADQRLRDALGPPGSTHIEQKGPTAGDNASKRPNAQDPRLRNLNQALGFHGFPPLPYLPPFLRGNADASTGADPVEQLLERVNSGQGLPETVINEFASEKYSSIRSSWRLPSTTIPSPNTGLANSPWPIPHRNSAAQGSTTLAGPDGSRRLSHNFLNRAMVASNPITLFYTADEKYLWGSSWTTIFKVSRTKTSLAVVDFVRKKVETIMEDKFHGAYALLTQENVFVVSTGKRLEAYYDVPSSNGDRIMVHPEAFTLQAGLQGHQAEPPRPQEVFRALCMTHDGHIAWVTDVGRVGILTRDVKNGAFRKALATLMLGASKRKGSPSKTDKTLTPDGISSTGSGSVSVDDDIEVSNNIACDEQGGIYVVSSRYMHKVEWDGETLSVSWEEPYDLEPGLGGTAPVRLGEGSGSTPTLMGTPDRRYVVITDSAKLMNIVVMDARTGKVEARHPITFGDPNAKETTSEQSVLVHGWRMAVVNNQPTEETKVSTNFLQYLGSPTTFLAGLSSSSNTWSRWGDTVAAALPVIVGDAPKGVEQFEFDPDTKKIRSVWINKEVSIPNGIPTMSAKSQLMYGVGKRCPLGGEAAPLRGMWTLEALDWWTGVSKFHYNIGAGPMSNSVYSATQIGPNEIITGTAGGIVRIREI
ncbi:hypothetical protein, conserved [Eimeria tenella]|uniref:Uncharacterized protein n=1 Tax=Eimeria tenella TaxID=5802 RepID=U6KTL1_EIMTE|nr:hypothetical protein, conserved [Eimeria tenella]CDJ40273.1 hypothetical protein, conserved [Eimeria tenella]|eukprot:XP_013231026.1 hypothetical protein, conserved [Eimeria tenella]